MQKIEEWALPRSRIEDFFRTMSDVTECEDGFKFRCCRVSLVTLPDRVMGGLHFPLTRIVFDGDAEDLEIIYRRFFMRFVSAGG